MAQTQPSLQALQLATMMAALSNNGDDAVTADLYASLLRGAQTKTNKWGDESPKVLPEDSLGMAMAARKANLGGLPETSSLASTASMAMLMLNHNNPHLNGAQPQQRNPSLDESVYSDHSGGSLGPSTPNAGSGLALLQNLANGNSASGLSAAASAAAAAAAAAAAKAKRPSILNRAAHDVSKYKTQMCNNILRTGTCEFGDLCVFAHSKVELRDETDNATIQRLFPTTATAPFPAGAIPPPPPPPPGFPPLPMFPFPLPPMMPGMMPPLVPPILSAAPTAAPTATKAPSVTAAAEGPMLAGLPPVPPPELLALYGLTESSFKQAIQATLTSAATEPTNPEPHLPKKSSLDSPVSNNNTNGSNNSSPPLAAATTPLLPNIYPTSLSTDFVGFTTADLAAKTQAQKQDQPPQMTQIPAKLLRAMGTGGETEGEDEKFTSRDFHDLLQIIQGMTENILRLQTEVNELKAVVNLYGLRMPSSILESN